MKMPVFSASGSTLFVGILVLLAGLYILERQAGFAGPQFPSVLTPYLNASYLTSLAFNGNKRMPVANVFDSASGAKPCSWPPKRDETCWEESESQWAVGADKWGNDTGAATGDDYVAQAEQEATFDALRKAAEDLPDDDE